MTDEDILKESRHVRVEASEVLKLTDIENYLSKFGEVHLIGSYRYNVMLKRDIDFHVVVKEFSEDLVKAFFNYTVGTGLFEHVQFHDKYKFNKEAAARYPSKAALECYYFGLRFPINSNEWKIDVNFITKPQEKSVEVVKLFDNASEKQRIQILRFKKLLQEMQVKMSSAYIYRAVIERNIDDEEELFEYLRSIGYAI
jgi:hypothetical protein